MSTSLEGEIKQICQEFGNDRTRLLDIVQAVQREFGWVSGEAMEFIAREVATHRVEVEGLVSFYAFLSEQPKGKTIIRLADCPVCNMFDGKRIADLFKARLGVDFGETTPDGRITLERTSCMGMCDQGPAALINDVVVTHLSADTVAETIRTLLETGNPRELVKTLGDGKNASSLVQAMVANQIRVRGPVLLPDLEHGAALRNALAMTPAEVIRDIKTARLRGRGGAGFPTGLKWEFASAASGEQRFVLCNADEGEPGTFKDRVILTENPDLVFEGMTIAGYAIGAAQGVVYLRGEYKYLKRYLDEVLDGRRAAGLLGQNVCEKAGFDFDVRIQLGAGAYVCGEETALINSCEGARGEPRDRPPFPAEKGYLDSPTIVNNVETFCCAARILEKGAPWFARIGSPDSSGTKLFSVSGDCQRPGIYELAYGITLRELLTEVGGEEAMAVQVGGPSGQCINRAGFDRKICYDDLSTGGSVIVFGPERNILDIVAEFMDFFIEECCGWCTPCRVGNVLIRERLERIRQGKGEPGDLEYLEELCRTVKTTSRCGFGQTSPNPVLTTLQNFRDLYERGLKEDVAALRPAFDLNAAIGDAMRIRGRQPVPLEG